MPASIRLTDSGIRKSRCPWPVRPTGRGSHDRLARSPPRTTALPSAMRHGDATPRQDASIRRRRPSQHRIRRFRLGASPRRSRVRGVGASPTAKWTFAAVQVREVPSTLTAPTGHQGVGASPPLTLPSNEFGQQSPPRFRRRRRWSANRRPRPGLRPEPNRPSGRHDSLARKRLQPSGSAVRMREVRHPSPGAPWVRRQGSMGKRSPLFNAAFRTDRRGRFRTDAMNANPHVPTASDYQRVNSGPVRFAGVAPTPCIAVRCRVRRLVQM